MSKNGPLYIVNSVAMYKAQLTRSHSNQATVLVTLQIHLTTAWGNLSSSHEIPDCIDFYWDYWNYINSLYKTNLVISIPQLFEQQIILNKTLKALKHQMCKESQCLRKVTLSFKGLMNLHEKSFWGACKCNRKSLLLWHLKPQSMVKYQIPAVRRKIR